MDGKDKAREKTKRIVPAFTMQALQKNTVVSPPPKSAKSRRCSSSTNFRRQYRRGDFPIGLMHNSVGHRLSWRVDINTLDYNYYLPLFLDGLRELDHPYKFFAKQGAIDLINNGRQKVLATVPKLIQPLKQALNTRHREIVCATLKIIAHLVSTCDHVGEALVPYYRQLLPVLNEFKSQNSNTGDSIDYGQRRQDNIGDLVEETLALLEKTGGSLAYINIKYMVPTYESCVHNR